jgi:SAM-dependent methyltransferase
VTGDLEAIVSRMVPPEPWAEGEKIPWNDPAFSERMLAEHLSQSHDAASRRVPTIDKQVDWIQTTQLEAAPSRVLDLACGPGLYAVRLARLGHVVHGIDFSPASIRYALAESEREHLSASFELGDIRSAAYGSAYDFAMLVYGELNVFKRDDALQILIRTREALRAGGRILIEPHTFDAIRASGAETSRWYALERGLFTDRRHLLLEESYWNEERGVSTHRWFVVDAATSTVERHADSMQAYTDEDYASLLEEAGFRAIEPRPDWPAAPGHQNSLKAFVASK